MQKLTKVLQVRAVSFVIHANLPFADAIFWQERTVVYHGLTNLVSSRVCEDGSLEDVLPVVERWLAENEKLSRSNVLYGVQLFYGPNFSEMLFELRSPAACRMLDLLTKL